MKEYWPDSTVTGTPKVLFRMEPEYVLYCAYTGR
jgi:hypothetical protein